MLKQNLIKIQFVIQYLMLFEINVLPGLEFVDLGRHQKARVPYGYNADPLKFGNNEK